MKHSEETKRKIRLVRLGKRFTTETKSKMSDSHKGKIHTDETKRKISDTMKRKRTTAKMLDPWAANYQIFD